MGLNIESDLSSRSALLRASRRTATSETEPAAILRDGAPQVGCSRLAHLMCRSRVNPRSVRLLRMRSVGLRAQSRQAGCENTISRPYEGREPFPPHAVLRRRVDTKVRHAPLHEGIIKRLVERVIELGYDGARRAFRRLQREPRVDLEIRQHPLPRRLGYPAIAAAAGRRSRRRL